MSFSRSFPVSLYDAIQRQPAVQKSLDFGNRISINQLTTLRTSLEEDLQYYAALDVPAIGVSCRKLSGHAQLRISRLFQQSQLQVSSLGWIGSFLGFNGHTRAETMREARKAIRLAPRIGASTITVLAGPQAGHIDSHARRLVADSLRELIPFAHSSQVTLALMPTHPRFSRDWSFLTQLDDVLSIIADVDHPRVRLGLSTYHSWHEDRALDRFHAVAANTALVQVADWSRNTRCDNDRAMPGDGILPLKEMVAALESGGYRGWYELDVWSRRLWNQEPEEVLRRGKDAMLALEPGGA
ncbi:MAG: sugar phosphate isomerase/epimerase [Planctomycetaceae bacterium]|nr:sugar phosphate isomerase/epimerase [Planctomycetaceae bacterium]